MADWIGVDTDTSMLGEEEEGNAAGRKRKKLNASEASGSLVPATAGAPTGGKKKGGGGQQNLPPRYKEVVAQVISNSRDVAILLALSLHTILISKDSVYVKDSQSIGKKYHVLTRGKAGKHTYGPPYVHIYKGLVQSTMKLPSIVEAGKKVLEAFLQKDLKEVDSATSIIKVAKVGKTYDKDVFKIQMNDLPTRKKEQEILLKYMKQSGGSLKTTVAPLGPRERKLLAFLGKDKAEEDSADL